METAIGYLELVREDLLEAGVRTTRNGPSPKFRDRFSGRALVAAAAAVTLLAAGTVGWWVTREDRMQAYDARTAGRPTEQELAPAGPMPATANTSDELQYRELFATQAALVNLGDLPDSIAAAEFSRVIRTAELGLELAPGSFEERFAEAVTIASTRGGFVADSTTRERSGSLVLRIPAEGFDETLGDLRALGDVEVQTIRGRDVTADYVDLRARLRIAKARRGVLLRLMDRATSIEQTIRVQNALDETQLRIEELQGQQRFLDDSVVLATIQLSLREEGVEPAEEIQAPSIPNAFERSAAGFVGVIAGIVVGLGYLIPVLLIALAAWFVVARVRRRRVA